MPCVRSSRFLPTFSVVAVLSICAASSAFATPDSARRPVIIDSMGGINDGQSGTIVRTGPLSWEPIVNAQPIAAPTELPPPESSTPMVIAPYIQLPAGGAVAPPRPQPRYVPLPQ